MVVIAGDAFNPRPLTPPPRDERGRRDGVWHSHTRENGYPMPDLRCRLLIRRRRPLCRKLSTVAIQSGFSVIVSSKTHTQVQTTQANPARVNSQQRSPGSSPMTGNPGGARRLRPSGCASVLSRSSASPSAPAPHADRTGRSAGG